jgi:hypothetical protein
MRPKPRTISPSRTSTYSEKVKKRKIDSSWEITGEAGKNQGKTSLESAHIITLGAVRGNKKKQDIFWSLLNCFWDTDTVAKLRELHVCTKG